MHAKTIIDEEYSGIIPEIEKISEDDYYKYIFAYSLDYYRQRVAMAKCTGYNRVLEAGCGYGQWAIALADLNKDVIGIDHSEKMLTVSNLLAKHFNSENIFFKKGTLPYLEFEDKSFDFIWCWSVFMFINRDLTLREFNRILVPGGRLFLGAVNGFGRWFFKFRKSLKFNSFNLSLASICLNVLLHGSDFNQAPNYTSVKVMKKKCKQYGFKLIAYGSDGQIDMSGEDRKIELTFNDCCSFENNLEFLLEKEVDLV
jgi:ubiquinone/menaquinone biosynthesis C-methylase UbiE